MDSKLYLISFLVTILIGCKMPVKDGSAKALGLHDKLGQTTNEPLYQDLEGKAIALSDYQGKIIIVSYWATWCRPCIEEMPSLIRAQAIVGAEKYIFLLPSDQSVTTIKSFIDKKNFDLNFLKFNGAFTDIGINALPTTFIYNADGEVMEKIVGGVEWDSPEMIQKLKDALK